MRVNEDEGAVATQETPKRRGRPPKAQQGKLLDMDHPEDAPLIKAIARYRDARDERMRLTQDEVAAQQVLLALMEERGIKEYVYNGEKTSILDGKRKVRVKRLDAEEGEEPEDGHDE